MASGIWQPDESGELISKVIKSVCEICNIVQDISIGIIIFEEFLIFIV